MCNVNDSIFLKTATRAFWSWFGCNGQYYLDAKTTEILTMNDLFRYCYMDTEGKNK